MRKESAVIRDFSRSDTLVDLAAALGLSGTEQKRLKAVIGTIICGKDSRTHPEIEALMRNDPLDDELAEGRVRTQDSTATSGHRRATTHPQGGTPAQTSAPPPRAILSPKGFALGQTSAAQRKCRLHDKWRLPLWLNELPNGEHECTTESKCKEAGPASPAPAKSERKGSGRGHIPSQGKSRRERSSSTLHPNHDQRSRKRSSPSGPPRTRAASPKRSPLTSPRAIADSLFHYMNDNPMSTSASRDGYFKLKDLMKDWGDNLALSSGEVLSAVSENLFKEVRGEMRAHFLIWQEDVVGADILLSIPEPRVQ
jgi:hypothetical protein